MGLIIFLAGCASMIRQETREGLEINGRTLMPMIGAGNGKRMMPPKTVINWWLALDAEWRERKRLTEGADAHSTLQSIYRDLDLPESLRAKAAIGALPVEKPKLMSVVPPMEQDRKQRWRAYERWVLTKQSLELTRQFPAEGFDAHLESDDYQPPEGDDEPPMDISGEDRFRAHVALSELLAGPRRNGDGGNGQDDTSG